MGPTGVLGNSALSHVVATWAFANQSERFPLGIFDPGARCGQGSGQIPELLSASSSAAANSGLEFTKRRKG